MRGDDILNVKEYSNADKLSIMEELPHEGKIKYKPKESQNSFVNEHHVREDSRDDGYNYLWGLPIDCDKIEQNEDNISRYGGPMPWPPLPC